MEFTIEYDVVFEAYIACFENGENVLLGASSLEEAELEAEMILLEEV